MKVKGAKELSNTKKIGFAERSRFSENALVPRTQRSA
jgi:hypothetical protein